LVDFVRERFGHPLNQSFGVAPTIQRKSGWNVRAPGGTPRAFVAAVRDEPLWGLRESDERARQPTFFGRCGSLFTVLALSFMASHLAAKYVLRDAAAQEWIASVAEAIHHALKDALG
jgi:hypothetical protein